SNVNGTLTLFSQASRGVFQETSLAVGNATTVIVSVSAADLDNDGSQDLVCAGLSTGESDLLILVQGSLGVFEMPQAIGHSSSFIPSVIAADLDGDGDNDVVCAETSSNLLKAFFQELPGRFGLLPLVLNVGPVGETPFSLVASDLDNDGDQDLVS